METTFKMIVLIWQHCPKQAEAVVAVLHLPQRKFTFNFAKKCFRRKLLTI
jgi:hypothetical protein